VSLLNLLTQSNIERWEMVIGIVGVCAIRWIAPGNDRKEAPLSNPDVG